jgi:uncharacterized protein YjiS (DUF1127 family)
MEAVMINDHLRGPRWSRLKYHLGRWQRGVRLHHELMSLDDRILRDIGLSRCDSKYQPPKTFWLW